MSGYNNRARSWLAFAVVICALACVICLLLGISTDQSGGDFPDLPL